MTDPAREELYPCVECGKLRTKAEGGTTFTVCDECWKKTMGETMTESNLVREEMMEAIDSWDSDYCEAKNINWGTAKQDLCSRLLRVIRGHTKSEEVVLEYVPVGGLSKEFKPIKAIRSVCDTALTHTLESLPEEK